MGETAVPRSRLEVAFSAITNPKRERGRAVYDRAESAPSLTLRVSRSQSVSGKLALQSQKRIFETHASGWFRR